MKFLVPNEAELARKAGLKEDESRWRGERTAFAKVL